MKLRPLEAPRLVELIDTLAALLLELDKEEGATNVPRAGTLKWVLNLRNAVWLVAHQLGLERSLPEEVPPLGASLATLRIDPFVSHARPIYTAAQRTMNSRYSSRPAQPRSAEPSQLES